MDPNQTDIESKGIAYGILGFLDEEFRKPSTNTDSRESLEVAMQCLETAFGVSLRDTQFKSARTLREVYRGASSAPSPTSPQQQSSPRNFPNGFPGMDFSSLAAGMAGLNPGGGGNNGGRQSSNNLQSIEIPLGEPFVRPPEATELQKLQGDDLKETGNRLMKDGEFTAALEIYKRAVDLDGNNAVYFCNRAAAYLKCGDLANALRDVQIAVQLQPDYARAYGRMGVIYSTMGKHLEAYSCYKEAVVLEPSNESYINNLKVSQELLESQMEGGRGAMDPMASITQMFQNPQLMSMASQMLQDPGMQNMMRTIVQGLQTGNTNTGDGGFEQLLHMGQQIAQQLGDSNPELTEQLSSQLRNPNNPSNRDPPNQNDSYDL